MVVGFAAVVAVGVDGGSGMGNGIGNGIESMVSGGCPSETWEVVSGGVVVVVVVVVGVVVAVGVVGGGGLSSGAGGGDRDNGDNVVWSFLPSLWMRSSKAASAA